MFLQRVDFITVINIIAETGGRSDEQFVGPFSEQTFASAHLGGRIGIKKMTQNYEHTRNSGQTMLMLN